MFCLYDIMCLFCNYYRHIILLQQRILMNFISIKTEVIQCKNITFRVINKYHGQNTLFCIRSLFRRHFYDIKKLVFKYDYYLLQNILMDLNVTVVSP